MSKITVYRSCLGEHQEISDALFVIFHVGENEIRALVEDGALTVLAKDGELVVRPISANEISVDNVSYEQKHRSLMGY